MKQMNETLRKKLIDGIAKGDPKQIKEAMDEVNGKIFRVRTFEDMMVAEAIKKSGKDVKLSYELGSEFDEARKRAKLRREKEALKTT